MPMDVYWANDEKTVIHTKSMGKWTWDEYHSALDQIMTMFREVDRRVDLNNIETPGSSMPPGSPQPHFERATKIFPENAGMNVLVTSKLAAKFMLSIWSRLPGNKLGDAIQVVGSLEEAYDLIEKDKVKRMQ